MNRIAEVLEAIAIEDDVMIWPERVAFPPKRLGQSAQSKIIWHTYGDPRNGVRSTCGKADVGASDPLRIPHEVTHVCPDCAALEPPGEIEKQVAKANAALKKYRR